MSWFEAIIFGLVQGLTEFLPISSSAHLRILGDLMNLPDPGAGFTAIIQIGTECAVLLYFRRDIKRIIVSWCQHVVLVGASLLQRLLHRVRREAPVTGWPAPDPDARMGWLVILGTLPIGVVGFLFQDAIESVLRNLYIVAVMLIVFGLLLGWADKVGRQVKTLDALTWKDGLIYGCAQMLALIPGVSRSGGTITAGRLMGYTRPAAARYSFLLAIPAVLVSGFYQLAKSIGEPAASMPGAGATIIATVVAFAVGYIVIIAFLKIVSTFSYRPFVYYRIALGVLVIVLLLTNVLSPTSASIG